MLNLAGCFLSGQVTTVKAVAVLYIFLDSIVAAQYVYYGYFGPNGSRRKKEKESLLLKEHLADDDDTNSIASNSTPDLGNYQPPKISSAGASETDPDATSGEPRQVHGFILPVLVSLQFLLSCSVGYHFVSQQESVVTSDHKVKVWERRLLTLDATTDHANHTHPSELGSFQDFWKSMLLHEPALFWLGWGIGWASAILYLGSRLPQVCKNIKRGSVEGLSPIMFLCTVMGNLTYGLGVLLRVRHGTDVSKAFPFLVGSLGTLGFDFTILMQFCYYRNKEPKQTSDEDLEANENADDTLFPDEVKRAPAASQPNQNLYPNV